MVARDGTLTEALGLKEIFALSTPTFGTQLDLTARFLTAVAEAASSRGISINGPSDALDMSRDICLQEAAEAIDFTFEIIHEKYLCLKPVGVIFDWEEWVNDMELEDPLD